MYCSKCGQAVGPQPMCPNCGTPTGISNMPVAMPSFYPSRVVRHLRTLGILWVIFAAYMVLHWLLILPFLRGVLGGHSGWFTATDAWAYPFHPGGWLLHVIAIAVIGRAILSVIVGYALLTRQSWGRIYAIVIAVLTLLKPITGTILAIYTLWVLLSHNAGPEYDQMVLAGDGGRPMYPGVPPAPPVPPMPPVPGPRG